MKTVNPETQQLTQAVFIPKHGKGTWEANVTHEKSLRSEVMIDNDQDALRANQVSQPQLLIFADTLFV